MGNNRDSVEDKNDERRNKLIQKEKDVGENEHGGKCEKLEKNMKDF